MSNAELSVIQVSIDRLHLDLQNPRLPMSVRDSEEQVLQWMLVEQNLIELMISIGEVGYFPGETLLAVCHEVTPGDYTIVEGNRRLAAVKFLNNPDLAQSRINTVRLAHDQARHCPTMLPILVFPERWDILSYLGYRHVTGVRAWDTLSKARYVATLYERAEGPTPADKFRYLARTIGSRSDYVEQLLLALSIYEEMERQEFYGIRGLTEQQVSFSLLTTALSYRGIADFLGVAESVYPAIGPNPKHLEEFARWVFEPVPGTGGTRIGESRALRALAEIVHSPQALEMFRSGRSIEDSLMVTGKPSRIYMEALQGAKARLELAKRYSHLVDDVSDVHLQLLDELTAMARELHTLVVAKRNLISDRNE